MWNSVWTLELRTVCCTARPKDSAYVLTSYRCTGYATGCSVEIPSSAGHGSYQQIWTISQCCIALWNTTAWPSLATVPRLDSSMPSPLGTQ
ncbi:hypothetical protein GQ43DRAFT_37139 [Delitschia confertaspora ATCC 74209]|uniref:Uncharacterized protein n=1 Tax=Delitschia confertaspora ATCC 74209 TaxID=1513339 RepID=A0A9P4JL80_9PLEO|nr:hypothetical protein GQ43DRAFT_37139 [Delitschia confertaspora ATCC 74209]